MAKQLGVKAEEVVEMETRLGGQDVALEPLNDDRRGQAFAPIAYLADPTTPNPDARARAGANRAPAAARAWKRRWRSLDARSRRIIEARWLRENDPATLHDLAAEFGVSAERIRQIEDKAHAEDERRHRGRRLNRRSIRSIKTPASPSLSFSPSCGY